MDKVKRQNNVVTELLKMQSELGGPLWLSLPENAPILRSLITEVGKLSAMVEELNPPQSIDTHFNNGFNMEIMSTGVMEKGNGLLFVNPKDMPKKITKSKR